MTPAMGLAGRIRPMRHHVVVGVALTYATLVAGQAPPPQNAAGTDTLYRRFLDVMSGCTDVQLARRSAA